MLDFLSVVNPGWLTVVPGQGIRLGLPNLTLASSAMWLLLMWRLKCRHMANARTLEGARRAALLWRLPATVLHETAHWVTAWLLLARPSHISVWPAPRRRPRSRAASAPPETDPGTAGHVTFEANTWTAGLVALAPLWLLLPPCLLVWLGLWVPKCVASTPLCMALGLLLAVCWQACWPSPQDWALAVRYPGGAALLALAGWLAVGALA